jgi:hypothetical protein
MDPNIAREKAEFDDHRPWLQPPRVRILMVTDAEGTFNTSTRFGLGHVIEALADAPWWWVKFDVTTGHRNATPKGVPLNTRDSAAYQGRVATPGRKALPAKKLHFDIKFAADPRPELALANFDEIWLYGIGFVGEGVALRPDEITALAAFMDAGGGVLAMGDHADIGADLCSEVPRVKHMRKWKFGGPAGNPPPVMGADRIDTLQEGPTPGYQFEDQSDTVPQEIYPTRYYDAFASTTLRSGWRPYPVLCGIDGVIDVLPDHMHEGECVVPANLPGEFPGGVRPQVIAQGKVLAHATDNRSEGFPIDDPSVARMFGIVGAYDGHDPAAGVGRIVVDATWHHWVHVNLFGFASQPVESAEFGKIKNYYWNVATWLAPPALHRAMFDTAVYGLAWVQPFDEMRGDRVDFSLLGITAKDVLGRRAGQCAVTEWIRRFEEPELPWKTNLPDPPPFEDILQRFGVAMLGGMVQRAMELAPEASGAKLSPTQLGDHLRGGARQAFVHTLKRERTRQDARESLIAGLERKASERAG